MSGNDLEFYKNQPVPDSDIEELMLAEIKNAPQASNGLESRIQLHNSTSPQLSGGDIDAEWEEANSTGSENVGGHNPTPDQSNVEENANALGVSFEDNEPLNFGAKHLDLDRKRFELSQISKISDNSI